MDPFQLARPKRGSVRLDLKSTSAPRSPAWKSSSIASAAEGSRKRRRNTRKKGERGLGLRGFGAPDAMGGGAGEQATSRNGRRRRGDYESLRLMQSSGADILQRLFAIKAKAKALAACFCEASE